MFSDEDTVHRGLVVLGALILAAGCASKQAGEPDESLDDSPTAPAPSSPSEAPSPTTTSQPSTTTPGGTGAPTTPGSPTSIAPAPLPSVPTPGPGGADNAGPTPTASGSTPSPTTPEGPTPGAGGANGDGGSDSGGSGGAETPTNPSPSTPSTPAAPCDARATVANMRLGWNLGNSLDSIDASRSDTTVETAWGNPVVTPELMQAVANAGFGAVRIPVTWIGRFGPAPDFTISTTFMNRVEQVVNYALDLDLYVIINLHHDGAEGVEGQWISLVDVSTGQVSPTTDATVLAQFRKMWEQIADHFEDYGEHLIFESMNEIKVGYGPPLPAYYDRINTLNQTFVDVIRARGSYNPERCLVVPGYNTNIEYTLAGFQKPNDISANKLILSDHYYDPWSFAGEGSTHAWGAGNPGVDDWAQEDWVRSQVAQLKARFIDQELPMIWGEYGAVQQNGYENYRRYYVEYVTKAVHDAGIAPFVWDNGATASGAEGFGLFNRSNNTVQYPAIVEAMVRAVTSNYSLADIAKP